MTKQRESKLSGRIMLALRREGWWCFKVHGSALQMSGIPDVLVCAEGHFIGLETKNPGQENQVSARQDLVMSNIEAAGGKCFVVTSPVEAVQVVRRAIA